MKTQHVSVDRKCRLHLEIHLDIKLRVEKLEEELLLASENCKTT